MSALISASTRRLAARLAALQGSGMVGYGYAQVYPAGTIGKEAQDLRDEAGELPRLSLLKFIPKSQHAAIRNFTSVTDCTAYIAAAFAEANGRQLLVPAGLYNHADLQVPKAIKVDLVGEFASYTGAEGAVFNYTGAGVGLALGVDDGDPDVTGPARSLKVRGIHFKSATGTTALRVQNTALAEVLGNCISGYTGKLIDLRANVITRVQGNDIRGQTGGAGCYGIWCDDKDFGNYVVDILDNHIYQVNHAARFSEGRSLMVRNNTVENIRPGAAGGVWKFETAGYISVATFQDNYYENHTGYLWEGAGFTGAILMLIVRGDEGWGSGDAANVNPGVGNMPKTKVLGHDIGANLFVDAQWNAAGNLVLPSVYPSTSVFDQVSTIARGQVTNREYEDELVYSLRAGELLKRAGDFADLAGGAAAAFTKTGGAPAGWTNNAAGPWQLVADGIGGTFACYSPSAGDYDRCSIVVPLVAAARARNFVIGLTVKGWVALFVNGVSVYDSGASLPAWQTVVVKFVVPANAASFTLKLGSNAGNPFWAAEARLFEVGVAEVTEPGAMNQALNKAVKRLMKRGDY